MSANRCTRLTVHAEHPLCGIRVHDGSLRTHNGWLCLKWLTTAQCLRRHPCGCERIARLCCLSRPTARNSAYSILHYGSIHAQPAPSLVKIRTAVQSTSAERKPASREGITAGACKSTHLLGSIGELRCKTRATATRVCGGEIHWSSHAWRERHHGVERHEWVVFRPRLTEAGRNVVCASILGWPARGVAVVEMSGDW